ncbi:unnamed protein product [Pylaiella littoralis]
MTSARRSGLCPAEGRHPRPRPASPSRRRRGLARSGTLFTTWWWRRRDNLQSFVYLHHHNQYICLHFVESKLRRSLF